MEIHISLVESEVKFFGLRRWYLLHEISREGEQEKQKEGLGMKMLPCQEFLKFNPNAIPKISNLGCLSNSKIFKLL